MLKRSCTALRLLVLSVLCLLAACGSTVAGGGGGAVSVGGKVDSPCNVAYGEGCYTANGVASREKCDGGKWALIADCNAGEVCQEKITTPGQAARTTECKAAAVLPGPDATSDGKGGDDGGVSDATPGDTAIGDATVLPDGTGEDTKIGPDGTITDTVTDTKTGDTAGTIAALLACAQSSCSTQWSACQTDPTCLSVLGCFAGCTSDAITCASTCQKSGDGTSLNLLQCANTACASAPVCGDGKCTGSEATTCPQDCATGPVCGNGICESGETNAMCPSDCPPTSLCGNGICDASETPTSCLQDCPTTSCCLAKGYQCGDVAACNGTCGSCGFNQTCNAAYKCVAAGPVCGNGTCEVGETSTTCLQDCPTSVCCTANGYQCGNVAICNGSCGVCGGGQTCDTSSYTCQTASAVCGNLVCETGETSATCPGDCPATGSAGCTSQTTAGCGGCACEATVCQEDPYCCNQDGSGSGHWDITCVGECKTAGTTCP